MSKLWPLGRDQLTAQLCNKRGLLGIRTGLVLQKDLCLEVGGDPPLSLGKFSQRAFKEDGSD